MGTVCVHSPDPSIQISLNRNATHAHIECQQKKLIEMRIWNLNMFYFLLFSVFYLLQWAMVFEDVASAMTSYSMNRRKYFFMSKYMCSIDLVCMKSEIFMNMIFFFLFFFSMNPILLIAASSCHHCDIFDEWPTVASYSSTNIYDERTSFSFVANMSWPGLAGFHSTFF